MTRRAKVVLAIAGLLAGCGAGTVAGPSQAMVPNLNHVDNPAQAPMSAHVDNPGQTAMAVCAHVDNPAQSPMKDC